MRCEGADCSQSPLFTCLLSKMDVTCRTLLGYNVNRRLIRMGRDLLPPRDNLINQKRKISKIICQNLRDDEVVGVEEKINKIIFIV